MIEHICVLSTAHITPEIGSALELCAARKLAPAPWPDDLIVYPHGEYGWLIVVPDEIAVREACQKPLADCLDLAARNGCEWLLLDNGASEIDNLPTYEW